MYANQTDIQKILGGVQQYVVPLFQRPYSWEKRQWNTLWQDLIELCEEENPRSHFIGSIVTMPARSVPEGVSKYILIDGQQRITTLLLILAAIRDKARSSGHRLAGMIDDLLLKNRHQDALDVYKLMPTQSDRAEFCGLMDGTTAGAADGQIVLAFEYFSKKLKLHDELSLEKLYTVIGKSLVLVSIVLDRDDNPYLIFESLNAKGRPLSQADLIRNFFFMRIHVQRQEEVFERLWRPMQELLEENLTEFIRHFLMRDGMNVKQGDVYLTIKERLEHIAGGTDENVKYLAELARFSDYYGRLLDPLKETRVSIAARVARLNRIEATTAYPFLLSAYDDLSSGRVSEADFASILDVLETFLIRRFVCGVPTNALSKIFIVLYSQASKYPTLLEGVRTILRNREFPSDRSFRDRLVTFRLYGTGDRLPRTRLVLEGLEQSFSHKEPIQLDQLTIEHVMPQTLTEAWKVELGENWELTHETLLHTLGNLTLTGYNPELSNADYAAKREILRNSHVELNSYFSDVEMWDEQAILRRAEILADLAVDVWPDFGPAGGEPAFEGVEEEDEQEDTKLLKIKVLEQFGGMAQRVQNTRYEIYQLADKRTINIKYSRPHKDYYWFGVHASLWDGCLRSGVTHIVFILGQYGFVTLPVIVVREYLAEAGTSPKSDGTVRHYHVLFSMEPNIALFHHGKPKRVSVADYLTVFESATGRIA